MGPDGAIYIADWYNPIIQHGEVDFRDPRRDHTHGRIWRVTAKGRPLVERPKLVGAADRTLLERLKAARGLDPPSGQARPQGARARRTSSRPWRPGSRGSTRRPRRSSTDRLEALWTYQSLDVVEPDLLADLLALDRPAVRAAAVRVLAHWHPGSPTRSRLLAPRSPTSIPASGSRRSAPCEELDDAARRSRPRMQALDRPVDRFLDYALWLTAWDDRAGSGCRPFESGPASRSTTTRHHDFALQVGEVPAGREGLADQVGAGWQSAGAARARPRPARGSRRTRRLGKLFDKNFDAECRPKVLAALGRCAARAERQAPGRSRPRAQLFMDPADPRVKDAAYPPRRPLEARVSSGPSWSSKPHAGRPRGGRRPRRPWAATRAWSSSRPSAARRASAGARARSARPPPRRWRPPRSRRSRRRAASSRLPRPQGRVRGARRRARPQEALRPTPPASRCAHMYAAGRQDPALARRASTPSLGLAPPRGRTGARRPQGPRGPGCREKGDPRARRAASSAARTSPATSATPSRGAGGAVGPDLLSLGASAPSDYILESVLEARREDRRKASSRSR